MKSFKPLVVIISVFIILSGHNVFAKAMSNADFNGRYIVGHFLEDIGESDPIHTDVLQFDADGKGKISGKGLYSNTGDTGSFNLNYSISQDGRISIDIDTESSLVGIISPDGQYFTLTKSGTNTEPLIMFGIKESTGRSVADLNGNYEMHGILYEDDELQIGGSQTMIFNGSGYWQWHDDPSGSGTYTVNSMGHLTMASHNGMESNDGSVLFIVSTDDPDVLEIIVGIRQSTEMIASDLMGEYCFTEIGTDNPAVSSDDYFYSLDVNSKNAYSFQELANSCGCPLKSGTGNYLMNSNGNFSLGKTAFGTLAEHGNVFAMFGYDEDFGYFGIGIPTSNSMEHELYYPHAASNTKWETEICAINTSSESIDGVFKVYNDKGEAISNDIETTLGAHARKEIIVGDDFTTPSDIGYIIFESDSENVIGYTKFYIDGLYRVAVPAVLTLLKATYTFHTLPAIIIGGPALVSSIQWQPKRI